MLYTFTFNIHSDFYSMPAGLDLIELQKESVSTSHHVTANNPTPSETQGWHCSGSW
jgi:hypothetical protein